MCLSKVYYNTYSDGAHDVTEKKYPCRDGRSCSRPDVRKYDRKFPFTKLDDAQPESYRSLSERKPTPYSSAYTERGSKSPSPSRRRDSGVYMSGANSGSSSKHYDYRDPYGASSYDPYGSYSRHDPRDRYDHRDHERERDRGREPRLKRSSTAPHIVYMDRDGKPSSSRSRSNSHSSSRDIPLGLVPLADEYGRRHSLRERDRPSSREGKGKSTARSRSGSTRADDDYYTSRRRTDDPSGYTFINDADEQRRRQRRERRSSYTEPSTSAGMGMAFDPYSYGTTSGTGYIPRRASTVVHHSDGSISTGSGSGSGGSGSSGRPKQLRWEDQVRSRRERQNAEIASRAPSFGVGSGDGVGGVKGILKHTTESKGKGKGREVEDIEALRRSIERMEIPRGRDREPRGRGADDWWGRGGGRYGDDSGLDYGEGGGRRKRSKVYADDRYRY